ncbi:MAG: hypothetical protein OXT67_06650 [Zetaproteobacteria bacterium]|nr:hypothetical protein [Zetaproteobacteria bacterium]
MNDLKNFENHLKILLNGNEYGEAVFDQLEDLIKKNPAFIDILENEFIKARHSFDKEVLANLIVSAKPTDPYKSYLITHHGWEESDFE